MNKQILRKISLIILPLLVIGVATYFLITSNAKEVKASVNISGDNSAFDLFKSYQTWPNSAAQKTGTAAEWLHTIRVDPNSPTSIVDINGDGLVDILVHQENVNIGGPVSLYHFYYGVLLNRGDLKFDLAYKCVYAVESGVSRYYGDCAL